MLRNVVEEAVLAEQVGLDHVSIGEHHRDDFAVSSPDMVLAAIASRTERVTLGTAVTVLSSDDPVRVYERFATLDALSNGRAEITLGRGSFTESFPLFGFDLADYEVLFAEKLDLFTHLLREQPVSWEGTTRRPLVDADVRPKTERGTHPDLGRRRRLARSPSSARPDTACRSCWRSSAATRSGSRRTPSCTTAPSTELEQPTQPIGVHSPGHVAATDEEARDSLWPHYRGDARPDRPRPRLAARHPRAVRRRGGARRADGRLAGERRAAGRPDDPGPRPVPVRPQVQQRHDAPRAADDRDRALRHRGRPASELLG